jgi:hypothetical protein
MRTWTDEQLIAALTDSKSVSDVLKKLGLKALGGSHSFVTKHIKRLGYEPKELFPSKNWNRGLKVNASELFIEKSKYRQHTIRLHFKKLKCISYICQICKCEPFHMNKELILNLDHINGINNDHRLENLRWLCPNCHSQTDTFAGKNNKKSPLKPKEKIRIWE